MTDAGEREREFAGAEVAFRSALKVDGADAEALKGLARLLAMTGRADEAVVLLRTRLRQEPEDAEAWRGLGFALCRQAGMESEEEPRRRRYKEAAEAFRHAVERGGWDAQSASGLAASLAGLDLRGEALSILSEALGHVLAPPSARLRIYGEALLFQVMWGLEREASHTALLMKHEATNEPDSLQGELLRLAGEARRMAGAGPSWSARALFLADLLEGLAP